MQGTRSTKKHRPTSTPKVNDGQNQNSNSDSEASNTPGSSIKQTILFTPSSPRHMTQATMPARSPLLDRTNLSNCSDSSDSDNDSVNSSDSGSDMSVDSNSSLVDTIAIVESLLKDAPNESIAAKGLAVIARELFDTKASFRKLVAKLQKELDLLPSAPLNASNAGNVTPGSTGNATGTHAATPKMAPTLLPKAKEMEGVDLFDFDRNIMHTHRQNAEEGVPYNTAVSNKARCRKILIDALDKIGTPRHQAFILYDILTDPERINIGVALGLVHHPDQVWQAIRQIIESIREFLHSPYVLERQTNESKSAQMNLFLYAVMTAPPDARTDPKAKRKLQKAIRNFSHLFELPHCAKMRLVDVAFRRAELMNGMSYNPELVQYYQRKSTCIVNTKAK